MQNIPTAVTMPLFLLCAGLLLFRCTTDELPEPQPPGDCGTDPISYEEDIFLIIQNTCAYSGCHLDSAPGTYDTYQGLLPTLENGTFIERIVTLRDDPNLGMPPDYAPADRPKDLTEEELQLIRCWVEMGYPE